MPTKNPLANSMAPDLERQNLESEILTPNSSITRRYTVATLEYESRLFLFLPFIFQLMIYHKKRDSELLMVQYIVYFLMIGNGLSS